MPISQYAPLGYVPLLFDKKEFTKIWLGPQHLQTTAHTARRCTAQSRSKTLQRKAHRDPIQRRKGMLQKALQQDSVRRLVHRPPILRRRKPLLEVHQQDHVGDLNAEVIWRNQGHYDHGIDDELMTAIAKEYPTVPAKPVVTTCRGGPKSKLPSSLIQHIATQLRQGKKIGWNV